LQWKTWFETFFDVHLTLLPGPLKKPSPQELCDLYFCTFPEAWKTAWFAQGRSIHTALLPMNEITTFMHAQELVQLTQNEMLLAVVQLRPSTRRKVRESNITSSNTIVEGN
jgi:hypothetical protein